VALVGKGHDREDDVKEGCAVDDAGSGSRVNRSDMDRTVARTLLMVVAGASMSGGGLYDAAKSASACANRRARWTASDE